MARKPLSHRSGDHWPDGGEDDTFPPGPNYLARFRRPLTEEEMEEAAAKFEAAVIEWLRKMDEEREQPSLPGLLPDGR